MVPKVLAEGSWKKKKENSFEVLVGLNEAVETGRRKFIQPYATYVAFNIESLQIERENCALFQRIRVLFKENILTMVS